VQGLTGHGPDKEGSRATPLVSAENHRAPKQRQKQRHTRGERETRGAEDLAAEAFAHPNKAGE